MTHLQKGSKLLLMTMTSPIFLLILRALVRFCQDALLYTSHLVCFAVINYVLMLWHLHDGALFILSFCHIFIHH